MILRPAVNRIFSITVIALLLNSLIFAWLPKHALAAGTTYYVDSVNGNDSYDGSSESQAWQSLGKVNGTTFQPGDRILFKAGSVWTGQLWPKGSGAEGKPIVIDQYGTGSKPVIHGGGSNFTQTVYNTTMTYNTGTVLLRNQEYWEINNLEVTNDEDFQTENNDSNALRAGIFFVIDSNESDRVYNHIYIRNCYIHDVDGNNNAGPKENGGIIGVIKGSYATSQPTVSRFNDVRIENNAIRKVDRVGIRVAAHANYVQDDSFSTTSARKYGNWNTNFYLGHNTMNDIGGDGIILRDTDGAIVEHNLLSKFGTRVTGSNAVAGIWLTVGKNNILQYNDVSGGPSYNQDGCAFDFDYYLENTIYQFNYSHDNPMGTMLLMGGNKNDVMRYNVSQNDGAFIRHFASDEATPASIYNNVFYYDGAKFKVSLDSDGQVQNGYSFYNNIFYNANPSVPTNWGTENWGQLKFSNNVFYEAGGMHPDKEPNDPNKVTADPKFVNPGGAGSGLQTANAYELRADSPAINAGLAMDNNGGQDFKGNPLYNGLPDLGAFEYQGDTSAVNHQPFVANSEYSVKEGSQVSGKLSARDSDGDKLLFSIVSGAAKGVVQLTDSGTGDFVYTPNPGEWGSDSFTFKVSDGKLESAVGTVTVAISPAHIVQIGAAEDAFVRDGSYANTNYGTGNTLEVKADASSYNRQTYLKFDLSTFSGTVESAKITLIPVTVGTLGVANEAYLVSDNSWRETTLTWNNKPAAGALVASWLAPAVGTPVQFDVTDQVKATMAADKKLSLQLITPSSSKGSGSLVTYASKENTTVNFRPFIEIKLATDTSPPVTTDDAKSGWQNTAQTIHLSAVDAGTGVKTTLYSLDGGPFTEGNIVTVDSEGIHELRYYSVDAANNQEPIKSVEVKVDRTGPIVSPTVSMIVYQTDAAEITFDITDAWSGLAGTVITLDGSDVRQPIMLEPLSLQLGEHSLRVTADDLAGNVTVRDFKLNVIMDIAHLEQLLQIGSDKGWITNHGVLNSLMAKVHANSLNALENEVQAQAGKKISTEFANLLLTDIAYLKKLDAGQ